MSRTKFILLALLVLICPGFPAFAQDITFETRDGAIYQKTTEAVDENMFYARQEELNARRADLDARQAQLDAEVAALNDIKIATGAATIDANKRPVPVPVQPANEELSTGTTLEP